MKTKISSLKLLALATVLILSSCVSDDLADVGDLEDITGPTPFYNYSDVTFAEFDCEDVELSSNYQFNFQAGSNLAVNGTQYLWSVADSDGNNLDVTLINKDLPVLELLIDAELAEIVAIEEDIAELEFKIPCEDDPARVVVMESQLAELELALVAAENALTDDVLQNVADLEAQILALDEATLQDQELIIEFPSPGTYTVGLTVTDNLNKSNYTEKLITVNQAVPTIPVPEIAEASFEDNSLFDGSGDGRDSWRVPSNDAWSPLGGGTTVIQINTDSSPGEGADLPDGVQAAKFPAGGDRVAYQEIEVTPGAEYVITYFTAFEEDTFGQMKVSILSPNTSNYAEAQLEENIIATRTDTNVDRVDNVFKQHSLSFEAGDNESVIIFATNSGVESRLDAFNIVVR
ncbi:PKD domain-containing protein [Winogradskyella endarachnes]|nr:PKD domain-containing protein [Winogradskyella endarachnes]